MTDRFYRLIIGGLIIVALYFDFPPLILAIIGLQLLEGVSNWRVPLIVNRVRGEPMAVESNEARIPFDAERGWRLMVGLALILSYLAFRDALWFFPWFMGFAIFGAGLSGVCPMLLSFKYLGFR